MAVTTVDLVHAKGLVISCTYDDLGLPDVVPANPRDGGLPRAPSTQRITSVTVDSTAAKRPVTLTITTATGEHAITIPAGIRHTVPTGALRLTDVLAIGGSI